MSSGSARVLLIGAYERDNFGDLLFLVQTEHYLAGHDLLPAAPFAGDMTALLGTTIPAYGPYLERERFDHVWTVGGEVGATTFAGALAMSLPRDVYRVYRDADDATKERMLVELRGQIHQDTPYMPRLSSYPLNLGAGTVLHSVGLAGLPKQPAPRQREILHVFREATSVNVRDTHSSAILTDNDIEHTLSPDLVHTIARTRPQRRPADPTDVLIQISDAHLRQRGHQAYAEAIARSPHLAGLPIRLFLAGTARGHDSVASYRRIIKLARAVDPNLDIAICRARRPLDLVDTIASAKLWIGLSLHGRIVSAAYGVPRVSIVKRKLDDYARSWDPDMPFGITEETLDDAVATALSPQVQRSSHGLGEDLAAQSEAAVLGAASRALATTREERLEHRLASVETWRAQQQREAEAAQTRLEHRLEAQQRRRVVRVADRVARERGRLRRAVTRG